MVNKELSCSHADILSKYSDIYPKEFIECVRNGVSWLCTHNNIVYQSSVMIASDKLVYNTPGNSILRIGLIDTTKPLSGLTYYEVLSVETSTDSVSGQVVFNLKCKYTTPMGLSITIIPIMYFDPSVKPDLYSKDEIDAMISKLQTQVDTKADAQVTNDVIDGIYNQIETLDKNEQLTKLEAKVDDMLQSLALDFVTKEKLDEELAKLEAGDKELDLTSYLKVKDAETTYLKIADIATKPELVGPKGDVGPEGPVGPQGPAGQDGQNGQDGTSVTVDDVKQEIVDALKVDQEFKDSVKGEPGKDGTAANKDEVVAALKADETFKAEVKGEKGDTGSTGPQGEAGVSPSAQDVATAVKDEVVTTLKADSEFKEAVKGDTGPQGPKGDNGSDATVDTSNFVETSTLDNYVKTETLTTDYETKATAEGRYALKTDTYTKTEADDKFQLKAE